MQIEAHQSECPACGSAALDVVPMFHHMICAYVGPEYDFIPAPDGYLCPKCGRGIMSGDSACEIVGHGARCAECGREMPVSPEPAAPARGAA